MTTPPPDPEPPLPDFTGYLLRRAHIIFAQHWQNGFRDQGWAITPVQGGMLVMIATHPDITQAALARRLGVEAPTLQAALDKLVAQDLVRRARPAGERRSFHLQLTAPGAQALAEVRRFVAMHEAALLAPLDLAERATLRDLLARLVGHGQGLITSRQG